MKNLKALVLLFSVSLLAFGCYEDNDDVPIATSVINNFVWKGMNLFYLYKADVPDLANNRFSSNSEYSAYLESFDDPADLFESLIYDRQNVDRFSWIVDDYIALEQFFDGISTSNGMEYQLFTFSSTSTDRYGVVTHILPNTSAEAQGLKRGDIFYGIDGVQLTSSNVSQLLSQDNYSVNLGMYNDNGTPELSDDSVDTTSETIALTKTQYTENPILVRDIIPVNGINVGYLMYNGFTGTKEFNQELNAAFGYFKNGGATELVLDLRYNPGGSVYTAIMLSSLITGQFNGDVFSTEQWNSEFQTAFNDEDPELLINRFFNANDGTLLNSLMLSKVYVLTSRRSASASELVINCLKPYIEVVQIGTTTSGKYQASITLYDSPNFRREGANPNHTYAMQPLVYKSLNADGVTDYFNGLTPDIVMGEQINNMGVLGDENEPLLAAAIADITGTGRLIEQKTEYLKVTNGSEDFKPFVKGMYDDKPIPENLRNSLFE